MVGLVDDEPQTTQQQRSRVVFAIGGDEDDENMEDQESAWDEQTRHDGGRIATLPDRSSPTASRNSTGSDGTLHDHSPPPSASNHKSRAHAGMYDQIPMSRSSPPVTWATSFPKRRRTGILRFGEIVLTWIRRFQVVFAYVVVITGLTIYVVNSKPL